MNKDKKEYQIMLKLAEKANACEYPLEELKGYSTFEEAIEKSSNAAYYCYWYAEKVIKNRWSEGEKGVLTNPYYSLLYARYIIKGRWPEYEKVILTESYYIYRYAREVIKGRWPEGEKCVLTDPYYSFLYAINIIKGRWPEGEKVIKKDTCYWETYQEFLESLED